MRLLHLRETPVRLNSGPGSRRGLLGLVFCLLLAIPLGSSMAQTQATAVEHLEVALWPEYDQASMLVIYRFQLAADLVPPITVSLPIPAEIGQPHAVAWRGESGELFDAPFQMTSDGMISITIPEGNYGQLEYYDVLNYQDQLRSFKFEWPGTVELGGFSYEVQQPIGGSALSVMPAPDSIGPGPLGLMYAAAELGPQPLGTQLTIDVSYQKSSEALTLPSIQAQSDPLAATSTPAAVAGDLLPWILSGGGVLLVGAGAFYYLRGRTVSRPRRRRKPAVGEQATLELSTVYCHQCGSKAKVSDRFCRNCGTRLRT